MAFFDNMGGLLGDLGDYGLGVPRNTGGLIGDAERDAINKRALLSGGINAALTYLATPKNLNTGSILPYLGKAGLSGFNASQNTVDQALNTAYRNRILSGRDDNLYNVDGALVDRTGKVVYQSPSKQQKRDTAVVDGVVVDVNTGETVYSSPKQQKVNTDVIDVGGKKILINKDTGVPIREFKVDGGSGEKLKYDKEKDINGNYVYVPNLPGYSIKDMSGKDIANVQLKEKSSEKAATESQAKAATFFSQMTNASDELRKLQSEGFDPSSTVSQTAVNLAGTPLRGLAGAQAQRARQIQEQWSESFLRIKTGAAATKDEIRKNVETFFPRFGEIDPSIIAQKERARAQAEQDVLRMTKEGGGNVAPKTKELSAQDKQALDWATSNPTDPRSAQIKQKLGL